MALTWTSKGHEHLILDDDHQEMFDNTGRGKWTSSNEGVILYGGGRRYKVKNYYTLDAAVEST